MSGFNWMDFAGEEPAQEAAPAPQLDALLEGLNEPQREAVLHESGPLLILAGAGSGKTRVITTRIAYLLAAQGVRAPEVLAITFTNKAAREMRERVERLCPEKGLWISTFHSTCARILRREIEGMRGQEGWGWTRDFTIYDTYDKNQLIKELLRDAQYDTTRFRPALVGGWISDRKNGRALSEEQDLALSGYEGEVLQRIAKRYEEALRKNNALDFDDLQLKALALFDAQPGVRDLYAQRFRHVLVDEYQDTNRVQYLLTRHFGSGWGNVAVCGDPDQSIYSWRGADIGNILDFEQDFGAARVVKLEQNYRSTNVVLQAAQAVIRNNESRREKELWSDREDGELIAVVQCADEEDEAAEVVRQVQGAVADGKRYKDVAVFYRANFMQRAIERSLRLSGVPYRVVAGLEFYQRREIRDLIAYLRLAVNPADDVACARVVNVPTRGIGAKSVERLAEWAAERGTSLRVAIGSEEARGLIRGRAKKSLEAFDQLLELLGEMREQSAADVLERVLTETDYVEWVGELGDADQANREENIEELRGHAQTYDKESPAGKLPGFLQEVALVSDTDAPEDEEDDDKVSLLTLHSAKGLEFPVVLVCGCEDGLLPHARALEDANGMEEERRLFYVGMTRAMDQLLLTWAGRRFQFGSWESRVPSPFLGEIPEDLRDADDSDEESAVSEDYVLGAFAPKAGTPALDVGCWVKHDHFGRGKVVHLVGEGANARATVDFGAQGRRQLLLQYANLELI